MNSIFFLTNMRFNKPSRKCLTKFVIIFGGIITLKFLQEVVNNYKNSSHLTIMLRFQMASGKTRTENLCFYVVYTWDVGPVQKVFFANFNPGVTINKYLQLFLQGNVKFKFTCYNLESS
jgi:hypothetical protein